MTGPTCPVTVWDRHATGFHFGVSVRPCGNPAISHGLCARHEADRVRLGGAA